MERVYSEKYNEIVGTSPAMKKVFNALDMIEKYDSTVLIEGESGTGKELLAAAIHNNSRRRDKIFVPCNCSIFSGTLANSELFGHKKGSFTGAISDKKGIFEIADKGTLFLDEIGSMDLKVQSKLLRVLEDGTFSRVGDTVQKKVDVRIITATNVNLKKSSKLRDTLKLFESEIIKRKLEKENWNKEVVFMELGISRTSLNTKIKQLDIRPD